MKRSTLIFLTRGETPSVRAVALQLHFGMVQALREGNGYIHLSQKELGEWSGVSYASVKRACIRLREIGWLKMLSGNRMIFDYRRSCPAEKAQFEPEPNEEEKTFQEACTHPEDLASTEATAQSPSGEDGRAKAGKEEKPQQKQPSQPEASELSLVSQAIAELVAAGADRAGAHKAAKEAKRLGALDLAIVKRIVQAVQALPTKPYRVGGLLCAAVGRPELGAKILREHAYFSRKRGQAARKPDRAPDPAPGTRKPQAVKPAQAQAAPDLTSREILLRKVDSWTSVADPARAEELAWILELAARDGYSLDQLRTIDDLRSWL